MATLSMALTLTTLLGPPAPLASPAAAAELRCGDHTPLDGLSGDAHPVVLVHGWTGSKMSATRDRLEDDASREGRQYLLFDYERAATGWASEPEISACLARYIDKISALHRDRGGDGMVYLVGHSMGGLAIRFALDPRYGGIEGLPAKVGGVVTLDTPYRGSMWGGTRLAELLGDGARDAGFPAERARAWRCLSGGLGRAPFASCPVPPALDPEIPLSQVAGEVSFARTLFGVEAYRINLAGDGIVETDSQHGSRGTGGRVGPNQVSKPVVSCTVTNSDLVGKVGESWTKGTAWELPANAWAILSDHSLLDLYSGKVPVLNGGPELAATLARIQLAGCSHRGITTNTRGIAVLDEELSRVMARGRELSEPAQLVKLKVPASCRRREDVIGGHSKDYGTYAGFAEVRTEAAVFGDLTGDGSSDAVVPLLCSAGGVSWPEQLLIYGPGVRLLGSVDLGELDSPQEHSDVTALSMDDGEVSVSFDSYEGAGGRVASYRGTLRWADGGPVFDYGGGPLTVTYSENATGSAGFFDVPFGDGVVAEAGAADIWLRPAPPDFRDFIQSRWANLSGAPGCVPTVLVGRYSHRGFASGSVSDCGGAAVVWAKTVTGWSELFGYQDGPYCTDLGDTEREAIAVLGIECLEDDSSPAGLANGQWPTSGQ